MFIEWNPMVRPVDIITTVGLIFTTAGLFFAAIQFRQNTRAQRALMLVEVTKWYFREDEVRRFFYDIEYGRFTFDRDQHEAIRPTDEERWLDNLLYTYDMVGHLVKINGLSLEEAQILAYQALILINNPEVQKYLDWLDELWSSMGRRERAHDDARYLAEQFTKSAGGRRKR